MTCVAVHVDDGLTSGHKQTPWWVAGAGGQTLIIWTLIIIIYQLQKCVGNMVLHMVHTGRSKGVRKGHI